MKKNYLFKSVLVLIPLSAFVLLSFSGGNPAALSGSPGDNGNSCAQCHGSASNSNVSISTNIPVTGYAFNTEYDITITNTGGGSRNGFQVTAERDVNNAKIGTFISTNSATQTADSDRRIIHTSSGNSQNSWTFKWRSPSSEQGKITFYGSSVSGNSNFSSSGDQVWLGKSQSLPSLSIGEANLIAFDMYPNPASKSVNITLPNQLNKANVEIYNLIGKLAIKTEINTVNKDIDVSTLNNGIYILKVSDGEKVGVQRFIKN